MQTQDTVKGFQVFREFSKGHRSTLAVAHEPPDLYFWQVKFAYLHHQNYGGKFLCQLPLLTQLWHNVMQKEKQSKPTCKAT